MAFNQAISGLKAAENELNVIGNNVSNSATTGFKKSRVEFQDVFAVSNVGGWPGRESDKGPSHSPSLVRRCCFIWLYGDVSLRPWAGVVMKSNRLSARLANVVLGRSVAATGVSAKRTGSTR